MLILLPFTFTCYESVLALLELEVPVSDLCFGYARLEFDDSVQETHLVQSRTHTHFSELPENFSIALRAANTCSIRHLENK